MPADYDAFHIILRIKNIKATSPQLEAGQYCV